MADVKGVSLDEVLEQHGIEVPRVRGEFYDVWNTWILLNSFRDYTDFGPKPLQVHDIIAYIQAIGVPKEYTRLFLELIAIIDKEYLNYIQSKRSK